MWYDAMILCVLVFSIIRGAMKGFVWQLAVIASLVFCFLFAGTMSLAVAPYISVKPPLNRWIAMFILYAIFSFVAFGAARLIREWLDAVKFTEYDRHLGAVFGFVKGVVFCLFLTFFTVTLSADFRKQALDSHSGHAAAIVMDRLHPVMPKELHDVLEPYIHQLDQAGLDLKHTHDDHGTHDHADSSAATDPFLDGSDPFASAGGGSGLSDWLSKLPPIFEDDVKALVDRAFESTDPKDRAELLDKLKSAVPSLMRNIATEWRNGKPNASQPNVRQADARERERLLDEIADVHQLDSETRELFITEVGRTLSGVPDAVAAGALRDWHADVLALKPDPDPKTDARTRLDVRVVRQLAAAGIPLSSLSSALQSRLRDSQLQ